MYVRENRHGEGYLQMENPRGRDAYGFIKGSFVWLIISVWQAFRLCSLNL